MNAGEGDWGGVMGHVVPIEAGPDLDHVSIATLSCRSNTSLDLGLDWNRNVDECQSTTPSNQLAFVFNVSNQLKSSSHQGGRYSLLSSSSDDEEFSQDKKEEEDDSGNEVLRGRIWHLEDESDSGKAEDDEGHDDIRDDDDDHHHQDSKVISRPSPHFSPYVGKIHFREYHNEMRRASFNTAFSSDHQSSSASNDAAHIVVHSTVEGEALSKREQELTQLIMEKLSIENDELRILEYNRCRSIQATNARIHSNLECEWEVEEALEGGGGATQPVNFTLAKNLLAGLSSTAGRFKDKDRVGTLCARLSEVETYLLGVGKALETFKSQPYTKKSVKVLQLALSDTKSWFNGRVNSESQVKEACGLCVDALRVLKEKEKKAMLEKSKIEEAQLAKQNRASASVKAKADNLQLLQQRHDKIMQDAEQLVGALPEDTVKVVKDSTDPSMKRARLALRKLFAGGFNRVSNDAARMADVVQSTFEGGGELLAAADAAGWGKQAREYYFYSVAEQVVNRTESDQFNANHFELAFQYSCIIVDLCVLEPSIGNMLKGLIYSTCPYAIPKVKFDSEGIDDDTYKCKIGMRPGEALKPFTTRMTNTMVMLGVIMQTPATVKGPGKHPFTSRNAWSWLAALLNEANFYASSKMPPVLSPLLDGFLQIAGHTLQDAYGKQFKKLMMLIEKDILPRLQDKSAVFHGLTFFFSEYNRNGQRCSPPRGRKNLDGLRSWGPTT